MPHSPEDKKRVRTRLRRIKGQAEALERSIDEDVECGMLLQQIAALRGAANGLLADVIESHLRESFAPKKNPRRDSNRDADIESITKILKTYLK